MNFKKIRFHTGRLGPQRFDGQDQRVGLRGQGGRQDG